MKVTKWFLRRVSFMEHVWWLLLNCSASNFTSWQISPKKVDFGTFNQAEFGGEPIFISWSQACSWKGKVSVFMAASGCYRIRDITGSLGTFISSSKEGAWSILEANTTLMACNWEQEILFFVFQSFAKIFPKAKIVN